MSKLRECPFCGGENIYVDGYEHGAGLRWRIVCLGCMGMVDPGTIQQKYRAIEAWNLRADHLPDATKMVSNADRIRGMTDEEFAKIIAAEIPCELIPFCKEKPECMATIERGEYVPDEMCIECAIDWLQQPAKE